MNYFPVTEQDEEDESSYVRRTEEDRRDAENVVEASTSITFPISLRSSSVYNV